MGEICLKCGYERQSKDKPPDYECPKCGVVYMKIENSTQIGQKKHNGSPLATLKDIAYILPAPDCVNVGFLNSALFKKMPWQYLFNIGSECPFGFYLQKAFIGKEPHSVILFTDQSCYYHLKHFDTREFHYHEIENVLEEVTTINGLRVNVLSISLYGGKSIQLPNLLPNKKSFQKLYQFLNAFKNQKESVMLSNEQPMEGNQSEPQKEYSSSWAKERDSGLENRNKKITIHFLTAILLGLTYFILGIIQGGFPNPILFVIICYIPITIVALIINGLWSHLRREQT